jgi:predicted acyl esterase
MRPRGRIDGPDFDFVISLLDVDSDGVEVSLSLGVLGRGYFHFILVPTANCNSPICVIDGELAAIGQRIVEFLGWTALQS